MPAPEIKVKYVAPKNTGPDQPKNVLAAWTALEVLSPQSFRKPQELASGGDVRLVANFARDLPWENGGESAKPNTRLYYQVVLGTIPMDKSMSALLEVYKDAREERPQAKGEAIIGGTCEPIRSCRYFSKIFLKAAADMTIKLGGKISTSKCHFDGMIPYFRNLHFDRKTVISFYG